MLKILNTDQELEAIITDYWNDNIDEEINKNFVFTFSAVVDEKSEYLVNDNLVEVENNLFRIKYYETQMSSQGNIINVFCEQVAYDLLDDDMDYFTATGTPTAILTELFTGTSFTVGTVDFTADTLFSIQEPTNKRAILVQFANALGGELKFDKFEISLLTRRGVDEGVQFREAKNIRGITVRKDKRSGAEQTAYSVDLIELRDLPEYGELEAVGLGDTIRVISPSTSTDVEQRIVKYSYSPKQRINSSVTIANFVEGIEDTVTNIKQQTVYKERVYNGVKVGPENGFEAIRSDKKARTVMNATDGIKIQKGDGVGTYVDVIFLDTDGNAVFTGKVEASSFVGGSIDIGDGTFTVDNAGNMIASNGDITGKITAESGSIAGWSILPGKLSGAGTIEGGEITGAKVQTKAAGVYPRVEINSNLNLLIAESDANNSISLDMSFLGFPAIVFKSSLFGTSTATLAMIGDSLIFDVPGAVNFTSWSKIRNEGTARTLQQELNEKASKDVSTGSHTESNHNHGIPEGATWETSQGLVGWSSSGGFTHSHNQN